jgi:hypothetical protein
MKTLPQIASAEYVIHGVLKIIWKDGYEGVVDLRPAIDRGKIFEYLKDPEICRGFAVEKFGHSLGWIIDGDTEIDFGADTLRAKAENQAQLHKFVANMHW